MISIIIPVYNAEKYIKRCLDSVLAQTYSDWECILVDDGSKDMSGQICDQYEHKDSRFRVIHKQNGGVSAARNTGIDAVQGDWVTFSDSDDDLTSNALADFAEAVRKYPDAEVIRGGHTTITSSGKRADHALKDWFATSNHAAALKIAEDNYYSGFMWSSCFRKDLLEGEQFPSDITWCEDHIFTYRCMLKAKKIAFIPSVVYIYYLDDTYPVGFGKSLSFRPLDFNMAVHSAEEQRKVKLALAGNDEELCQMIQHQYRRTINLAFYYAHAKYSLLKVLSFVKDFDFITFKQVLRSYLGFNKTRFVHTMKLLLHKY